MSLNIVVAFLRKLSTGIESGAFVVPVYKNHTSLCLFLDALLDNKFLKLNFYTINSVFIKVQSGCQNNDVM